MTGLRRFIAFLLIFVQITGVYAFTVPPAVRNNSTTTTLVGTSIESC
jgi:hypothetical protein